MAAGDAKDVFDAGISSVSMRSIAIASSFHQPVFRSVG
jgi:hypothetical protein